MSLNVEYATDRRVYVMLLIVDYVVNLGQRPKAASRVFCYYRVSHNQI